MAGCVPAIFIFPSFNSHSKSAINEPLYEFVIKHTESFRYVFKLCTFGVKTVVNYDIKK